MPWYCGSCGSPNGEGLPRCKVCGAAAPGQAAGMAAGNVPGTPMAYGKTEIGGPMPQQPPGPGQPMGGAPPGWGQPGVGGPPPAYGPPAGPGPAAPPPAFGAPAYAPGGAMGPMGAAPAARSDDSGFKIGCAIVGCLGAVGAIVAIIIVVVFFTGSAASTSSDDDDSSKPHRTKHRSGRLSDRAPKSVGAWHSVSAKPIEVAGATDALVMLYRSGSEELALGLTSFSSTGRAKRHFSAMSDSARQKTGKSPLKFRLMDKDDRAYAWGHQYRASPEIVVMRMGKVTYLVHGPSGSTKDFVRRL